MARQKTPHGATVERFAWMVPPFRQVAERELREASRFGFVERPVPDWRAPGVQVGKCRPCEWRGISTRGKSIEVSFYFSPDSAGACPHWRD